MTPQEQDFAEKLREAGWWPIEWKGLVEAAARLHVQEMEKEKARYGIGDWCDSCEAPQWVNNAGEHKCGTYTEVQARAEEALRALDTCTREHDDYATRLADLQAENERLRAGLRKAHACATLRDGGTCDGCFVSELLKEEASRG